MSRTKPPTIVIIVCFEFKAVGCICTKSKALLKYVEEFNTNPIGKTNKQILIVSIK